MVLERLLVIGGSGLLGYKILEKAGEAFEVHATYNKRTLKVEGLPTYPLDKTLKNDTLSLIDRIRPNVVVDTAAIHNVDYCETHQEEAWRVNVEGTRNVAGACQKIGAKMIFISTDYIFDGKKGFYREEDEPNPLNHYALTKLEAERLVAGMDIDYAIVRPSVIYGWNPNELRGLKSSSGKSVNFALWTINKLRNRDRLRIVADQYSSPTLADSLAEATLALYRSGASGIYHIAGKGCVNRFDFAVKIAEVFQLDKSLIEPTTSDAFKQIAQRPKRCCLDVSKAERELGVRLLTIEEGLNEMRAQLVEKEISSPYRV